MQDKEEKNNYYVYLHKRKDNDKIFYVGKGKNKRYISLSGRNRYWKNTSIKYGWYSTIIQNNLSEPVALELEEFLISEIGIKNLCNQNYFNGGKSGYRHTEETKLKMRLLKLGKLPWNKGIKSLKSSERMKGTNNPMYGKKKIHSQEVLARLSEKNGTLVCDLETGIFYNSIIEMSFYLNRSRKSNYFKNRTCR